MLQKELRNNERIWIPLVEQPSMLSENKYTQTYIDGCRKRVERQVTAYRNLVKTVRRQAVTNENLLNSAIESFEPQLFNNMVLVLDSYFVHRSRALELKDGNALNEVRMLCESIMRNNNKFGTDKSIKYDATTSVLKYKLGDEIKLHEPAFTQLSKAYFAEIEKKYR
jgi:hypothetical protein